MSTDLERQLIARIKECGPITFRDFMAAALYDSDLGYYNTERLKIGPEGDYYTSSNVHPAFGAVLATAFIQLWSEFSELPLHILEAGAGTGRLAADILVTIASEHPGILESLTYTISERSTEMRRLQAEMLKDYAARVNWIDASAGNLESMADCGLEGVIFSNELMDAMPVHRLRWSGGVWEEQFVDIRHDASSASSKLTLTWYSPSSANLVEYLSTTLTSPREGQICEVNLEAIEWLRHASGTLRRGFIITIDYGDVAGHLYDAGRSQGTLRAFYRHRISDDLLARPGMQDLTSSVNFTALMTSGEMFGLRTISYERQGAFLMRMGLVNRIAESINSAAIDEMKDGLAIKNLFVPGGVSDNFRVLIQRKA